MRRFGLEVEFIGDLNVALAALRETGLEIIDGRHSHLGHSNTGWTLKRDGSVQSGGELVSPPLDFDDPEQRGQVNLAVEALQRAGACPDPSAGIHVHIEAVNTDGSHFDGKQVAAVVRFAYKFEDAIYRIASSGWETIRPGARTYAQPIPETTAQAIMKARTTAEVRNIWDGMAVQGGRRSPVLQNLSRYCGVNLRSWIQRNTIEFRYFNSSVNPVRIQTYIALCVAIVEDARRGYSRSVKKSYKLGGMASGAVTEDAVFLRLQQVLRTESRDTSVLMSEEDWKNLRKVCWKASKPQENNFTRSHW